MLSIVGVKHRHVIQHILLYLKPSLAIAAMDSLLLQAPEEAFSYHIVPTTTLATHTTDKTRDLQ